ncbi:MAG: class I SAM-dependent RNA methyltransferase [Candidatus Hydrogenedentota bacterium]|nr:MAG: class I SAM-dependent RNA methyltransferase [Candidatus Hydrogenedentota bacterium]
MALSSRYRTERTKRSRISAHLSPPSEFEVEKIVANGYGLIRTFRGVILCRAVIPGETVRIHTVRRAGGVLWGEEFEILSPSPRRIDSPCPYFPLCGGCDFLHLSSDEHPPFKNAVAAETFRRILGFPVDVVGPFEAKTRSGLGYRHTIRLQGGAGYLGYCRKSSHDIIDIEDCLVAAEPLRGELRRWKRTSSFPARHLMIRCGNIDETELTVVATRRGETRIRGDAVHYRFGETRLRVSARSFFQNNPFATQMILSDLTRLLPDARRFIDLFAGVGTFALTVGRRFPHAEAYEISRDALRDLEENAAGLSEVSFQKWDAARGLRSALDSGDIVFVDPPRTGLPPRTLNDLSRSSPRLLVYLSCDVATMARDLKTLLASGFHLDRPIRLYEMFPQTAHMEALAFLKRSAGGPRRKEGTIR